MRTLIVGYGNADRQDDGIAWHILCDLAQRLGRPIPAGPEEGFFPEGQEIDLWFVPQLTPEMSEDFAQYHHIYFVDAHTGNIEQDVMLQPVEETPAASAFTHHLTPAACMALTRSVFKASPEAKLLSVRGYQFEFTRDLSPKAEALVKPAADILWDECQGSLRSTPARGQSQASEERSPDAPTAQ